MKWDDIKRIGWKEIGMFEERAVWVQWWMNELCQAVWLVLLIVKNPLVGPGSLKSIPAADKALTRRLEEAFIGHKSAQGSGASW